MHSLWRAHYGKGYRDVGERYKIAVDAGYKSLSIADENLNITKYYPKDIRWELLKDGRETQTWYDHFKKYLPYLEEEYQRLVKSGEIDESDVEIYE